MSIKVRNDFFFESRLLCYYALLNFLIQYVYIYSDIIIPDIVIPDIIIKITYTRTPTVIEIIF